MLNLDILGNIDIQKESKYYEYRKDLHDIYDMDVWYGDLVGNVLALREKDRYIDTVNVDIRSYKIYVELSDKAKDKEIKKVVSQMKDIIDSFIGYAAINMTFPEKRELISSFLGSQWPIFDYYVNGNVIEFDL